MLVVHLFIYLVSSYKTENWTLHHAFCRIFISFITSSSVGSVQTTKHEKQCKAKNIQIKNDAFILSFCVADAHAKYIRYTWLGLL